MLPTYAEFIDIEDLNQYDKCRARFFRDHLHLPPQIFRGTSLVEFGPDSGENALVFARWGANVTLVEPNHKAWPSISSYFERFNLKSKLSSLEKADLESFQTERKFNFVNAEGFIYTVKPDLIWINQFDRILEHDGFFNISYTEFFGSIFELIHRVLYLRAKDLLGQDSPETSRKLFEAKWESIPHTRSFDSWAMDSLENPFVREKYFIKVDSLCRDLLKAGFSLYSSWPNYIDQINVYWHKKEVSFEHILQENIKYISRNSLSFMFGKKLFICSDDVDTVESINNLLRVFIVSLDRLIDGLDSSAVKRCYESMDGIKRFLLEETILINSQQEKKEVLQSLESIHKILNMIDQKDIKSLISFCNSDRAFIQSWGLPHHFAVFKKHV